MVNNEFRKRGINKIPLPARILDIRTGAPRAASCRCRLPGKLAIAPRPWIMIFFIIAGLHIGSGIAEAKAGAIDSCQGRNFEARLLPAKMSSAEKKFRFRCLVQPDIETVYAQLVAQYKAVQKAINTDPESLQLKRLRFKYRAENNSDLLAALKPHPRSIAIAQAAIESAWGTSRFFREANNIYGIRPFNQFEPRIAAAKKREGKTVWLRRYSSIKESIEDYYLVLGRGSAYGKFRQLKMKTSDPHKLVARLNHYSERKSGYSRELSTMIRHNSFYKLDQEIN